MKKYYITDAKPGCSLSNILLAIIAVAVVVNCFVVTYFWLDFRESRYWPKTRVVKTNNWYVELYGSMRIKESK